MKLQRVQDEPVLKPRRHVTWEQDAVLNAAAIAADGQVHLFYRGVSHGNGCRNRSCIGHAWSSDGLRFSCSDEPVLRNGTSDENTVGVEDPRVVQLEGLYHMCYTSWDERRMTISRATSHDLHRWEEHGTLLPHALFGDNKNATLFPEKVQGRYLLIHRPMGVLPNDMWVSASDDLHHWDTHRRLLRARRGEIDWEYTKVGLGAPPIRTEAGWLLVYHAVDRDNVYRLGLALLDLEDVTRVLRRTDEPILGPETDWERRGDVPNVTFTCGALLRGDDLWVYYGGADSVIGLARGSVRRFLDR